VAQKAGTLVGIKSLLLLYPAIALSIAAMIIGFMYKLTDKKHAEIVRDIHARS
jgi:GPH family glycoside/pentoside/hexuronide:cation symporter